jgi:hypothetical protein
MRVRATKMGYYGLQRRREGDVFELVPVKTVKDKKPVVITPEQQFSELWMEKVDADAKPSKKKEEHREPKALSRMKDKDVL